MNDIQEIMQNLEMIERKKKRKSMNDVFIGVLPTKPKKTKTKKYYF